LTQDPLAGSHLFVFFDEDILLLLLLLRHQWTRTQERGVQRVNPTKLVQ
jgi:hypothetical protein